MNSIASRFLQAVVVLIGVIVLALLLWEPHLEGVNRHATFFQVYLSFFIGYVYFTFVPFFVALYQAFKLLGYARNHQICSPDAVHAVRIIKYCALAMIGLVAFSLLFMIHGDREDRPAGLFMRALIAVPAIAVATAAATFERMLRNTMATAVKTDLVA